MIKSPFDLINGIAVVRKKGRKRVSATCGQTDGNSKNTWTVN